MAIIQTLQNVRSVRVNRSHVRIHGLLDVSVQRHRAVQTADQVAAKRVADRQYHVST